MKRAGAAVGALGWIVLVVACVGDDPDNNSSSSSSSGSSSGSAADGGPGTGGCSATEKPCNGQCVSVTDTRTGCAEIACTPCFSGPNSSAKCGAGDKCEVTCNAGFVDCDLNVANGCETKVDADPANCGKCKNACGSANTTSAPTCEGGKCVFKCSATFAHCGADDSKGCETSLTTGDDCGECGYSCLGGACSGPKACGVATVASGQSYPSAITVDATNIYWVNTNSSQVMRVAKTAAACTSTAGCELLGSPAVSSPLAIANDGTSIFWSNSNMLRRASVAGATPVDIGAANLTTAGLIAVSGGKVFWSSRGTNDVWRDDVTGGNVTRIAEGSEPGGLAVDATHLYVAGYGGMFIYKIPVNATTSCTMRPDGAIGTCPTIWNTVPNRPIQIAVDGTNVYYTQNPGGDIRQGKKDGTGMLTVLAKNQSVPGPIVVDATRVYWGNFRGGTGPIDTVRSALIGAATCDGTGCTEVMPVPLPNALAVDGQAVYAVSQTNNAVYRRRK